MQLARNALRDAVATSPLTGVVAKRHVQPGEKVAFDSPLVTIVDLKDLELQAMVPAVDVPELAIGKSVELTIDGFGERRFTGRVERINPSTEPGTRAFLVYVGIPNRATARCAAACSRPAASRSPRARRSPTLPATAMRIEAGQTYVWTVEGGKLVRRIVVDRARATTPPAASRSRPRCRPELPVLGAKFDNLKDGAPALVKARVGAAGDARVGADVRLDAGRRLTHA